MQNTLEQLLSAALMGYVVVDSATGKAPTAPQLGASVGLSVLVSRLPASLAALEDPTTVVSRLVRSYAVIAFGLAYGVSRAAGHPVRMSLAIGTVVGLGAHAYYVAPRPATTPPGTLELADHENRLGWEGRPAYSLRQVVTKGSTKDHLSLGRLL